MKKKEHKRGDVRVENVRHALRRRWEECMILLGEI